MRRIAILAVCVTMMVGCDYGLDKTDPIVQEMQAVLADAQDAAATTKARLETLPPGPEREEALAQLERTSQIIDMLEEPLSSSETTAEALEKTGAEVVKLLPPPFNVIGIGVLGLLATFRAIVNRRRAVKLAESIDDHVTLSDEEKKQVSKAQGPAIKRIVDEAQGKRAKLPI